MLFAVFYTFDSWVNYILEFKKFSIFYAVRSTTDYVIFPLKLIYENVFTVIRKIAKKFLLQIFNLSG